MFLDSSLETREASLNSKHALHLYEISRMVGAQDSLFTLVVATPISDPVSVPRSPHWQISMLMPFTR